MESVYLKNSVGPVLAKAVAETVLAQPSNPQEYLALYLLHVLQEEERTTAAAALKQKVEQQRQWWAKERALREKHAVDTIQRFFAKCKDALRARHAQETALWTKYESAVAEAEELLDEEDTHGDKADTTTAAADNRNNDINNNKMHGNTRTGGGGEGGEEEDDSAALEEAATAAEEARAEFYKAQRFMLYLRKSLIGTLKTELVDRREQVRVEQDRVHDLLDATAAEAREREEAEFNKTTIATTTAVGINTLPSSATTAALVKQINVPRHDLISVSMLLYRVLRCWCYFFFDSTPKETDTPAKVAALVKPFTFMQLLRAFTPVATYRRGRPLRLEHIIHNRDDEDDTNGVDDEDPMREGDSDPLPQPKPRQARRVSRVLRVLMHDAEYITTVNPADFMDVDEYDEENGGVGDHGSATNSSTHNNNNNNNSHNNDDPSNTNNNQHNTDGGAGLRAAVAEAEAAAARGAALAERVESTARKHSVVLYALLRLLRTASGYRDARDRWLKLLQRGGHDIPAAAGELPEDDDADPHNDEAPRDEDDYDNNNPNNNAMDYNNMVEDEALRRLLLVIGVDEDEALAKLWAATDAGRRKRWEAFAAAAARRAAEEEESGGQEDDEDEEDNE
ncbi:Dpy-30 motif [Trypanosoma melophagium]|uniref:Dpy-30 motif n=1 Tax=Trypanosoma melophagium TaxID=715481 RepID=UPI00351A53B8|nr:Dpy-30 motif [Trypanosoma melophagium]